MGHCDENSPSGEVVLTAWAAELPLGGPGSSLLDLFEDPFE
jgi:hypothetical protein